MPIKTSLLALAIATAMTGALVLAPISARADEPTSVSVETTAPMPTSDTPAPASASVDTTAPMPTSDATEDATKAADAATAAATKAADEATAAATKAANEASEAAAATAKAKDAAAKDSAKAAKTVAKPVTAEAAAPAAAAPAGGISKAAIIARLKAAGYSDINDLKFEDAVWHADAKDPKGKQSLLTLAASDGHIILSKHD
jgi:hypothetical protein